MCESSPSWVVSGFHGEIRGWVGVWGWKWGEGNMGMKTFGKKVKGWNGIVGNDFNTHGKDLNDNDDDNDDSDDTDVGDGDVVVPW